MVRGLRIRNGVLEAAKNNDAAMDIDLTLEGDCWEAIRDDEGKIIRISVDDDNICITTDPEIEQDYTGTRWSDVQINCNSEQLKELALFAGEPNAYCYMDCTDGEYLPVLWWLLGQRLECWCVQRGPGQSTFQLVHEHRLPLRLLWETG